MTSVPASTGYKTKPTSYNARDTYYSSAYTDRKAYYNTSTAYDYSPSHVKTKPSANASAKPKASAKPRLHISPIRMVAFVAVLVAICFTILYRQSVILESNQNIKKLNKEYTSILSSNQAMQSKLNTSLETGEIELYAREKLGMMKPESAQIFYINMEMNDTGVGNNVSDSATAISGIQGTLVNAFRVLK